MALTQHGHHIPDSGNEEEDAKASRARCGGVTHCRECRMEVADWRIAHPPQESSIADATAYEKAKSAEKNADSTPPDIDPTVDLDTWEPQKPSDQTVEWDIDKNRPAEVTPAPSELMQGLREVINRSSAENGSGTPDFILATFLEDVLYCFDRTVRDRAAWRGESVELPALQQLHRDTETMDKVIKHLRELVEQGVITINEPIEATDIYRSIMDSSGSAHPDSIEVPLVMYTRGQRNDIGTARISVTPGEALVDKPIIAVLAEFSGNVPDAAYSGETSLLGDPPMDVPKDEPRPTGRFERYQKEGLSKND